MAKRERYVELEQINGLESIRLDTDNEALRKLWYQAYESISGRPEFDFDPLAFEVDFFGQTVDKETLDQLLTTLETEDRLYDFQLWYALTIAIQCEFPTVEILDKLWKRIVESDEGDVHKAKTMLHFFEYAKDDEKISEFSDLVSQFDLPPFAEYSEIYGPSELKFVGTSGNPLLDMADEIHDLIKKQEMKKNKRSPMEILNLSHVVQLAQDYDLYAKVRHIDEYLVEALEKVDLRNVNSGVAQYFLLHLAKIDIESWDRYRYVLDVLQKTKDYSDVYRTHVLKNAVANLVKIGRINEAFEIAGKDMDVHAEVLEQAFIKALEEKDEADIKIIFRKIKEFAQSYDAQKWQRSDDEHQWLYHLGTIAKSVLEKTGDVRMFMFDNVWLSLELTVYERDDLFNHEALMTDPYFQKKLLERLKNRIINFNLKEEYMGYEVTSIIESILSVKRSGKFDQKLVKEVFGDR